MREDSRRFIQLHNKLMTNSSFPDEARQICYTAEEVTSRKDRKVINQYVLKVVGDRASMHVRAVHSQPCHLCMPSAELVSWPPQQGQIGSNKAEMLH